MNVAKDINNTTPLSRALFSPQHVTDLTDHRYKILDDKVGLIPFGGRSVSSTDEKTLEKKLHFAQPAQPDVIKSNSKDEERSNSKKVLPNCDRPFLRRHQSEPVSQKRRSIFQHYWKRESCEPKSDLTPQVHYFPPPPPSTTGTCRPLPAQRARSVSINIPEHLQGTPKKSPLQKHFSVPRNHQPAVGKHFLPIGDMFLELEQILPDLPTPLQRYFRDGKKALLGGVYPLNAPTSILRPSSYRKLVKSESLPLQAGQDNASIESLFNLTQTCHKGLQRPEVETNSTASTSASRSRSVHFDPRVTVTEYPDVVDRQWFSDVELERFKCQTIALAQGYLMTEPRMMEVYSKSRLDPVTGTLRKKALFSLPVLSSTDDTELPKLVHRACVERRDSVEREVKNVLIVDPNTVVLDLFRRSLQTIFPKANISVAENGEDALRMVQVAMPCRSRGTERGFDIVITEERLSRNRSDTKANLQGGKSDSNLDELTSQLACQVVKHDSLSSLSQSLTYSGMSGSELLGKISEIEKTFDAPQSQLQTEAASLIPAPKRALLIGVSVRPDEDGPSLVANGADFVWGKPPPLMNRTLRKQMVSTLVNKRLVTQCLK
jgi:hypothetical protein